MALSCSLQCAAAPDNAGLGVSGSEEFKPGPAEAAARYASAQWRLVWNDEFEEGTAPSRLRWNYEEGRVRNHELQYYTVDRRENARIENGDLVITGRREPYRGADYTSASLTTRGHCTFTYGKVEIRAKVPRGRGTWPALWFLGADPGARWPMCGEVDLMENVGFDPDKLHFTVHTGAFNHVKKTQRGTTVVLERPLEGYHRYGLIWTHERIEFFLEGEKVYEFANDGKGKADWPFDSPMYLLINLALGGDWGGAKGMDDSALPAEFRVDYVRVWSPAPVTQSRSP
jgi:beta-glucanase (GH16 family)